MTEHEERQQEAALGSSVRKALEASPGSPNDIDAVIRQVAVNVGTEIRTRRAQRRWPALAASFLLGGLLSGATFQWLPAHWPHETLYVPVEVATRGNETGSARVPAESADPQLWYDYIGQLIYSGDLDQAERHLRRFNELHPHFKPAP